MIYQADGISVAYLKENIAELVFDTAGSVSKLDRTTLGHLGEAIQTLHQTAGIQGLVLRSNKDNFIVGADITEFLGLFEQPDEKLLEWLQYANAIFSSLEDLPFPTLSVIRGYALGGGCETILSTDFRIGDETARIGLPETKLGIMPGFGGTVRLPRVIGADNAMEWITTGKEQKAKAALAVGALDAVVSTASLQHAAIDMLEAAIAGKLDWRARRDAKLSPLPLNQIERTMSFTMAKGMVAQQAGPHYPAPMMAVKTIEQAAICDRDGALAVEMKNFIPLAKSEVTQALIGIFLSDQYIKSLAKKAGKLAKTPEQAAVLGAGIMGGGIAYQAALKGTPVVMKDIQQAALDLGLNEASKLLNKQVQRGRITPVQQAKVLNQIVPTLTYASVEQSDIVVEAVVENPVVKGKVLAELETHLADDAIITSNTSTISIDLLAESLQRKDKFCGMHFFNPVHRMPLVEIIRGQDTSDETIATVVAWAAKMGKSPIVVNDCPGFFVNRVLFPYFGGFCQLLSDGADFNRVDKIMERKFGWPMGPAYLLDVVGMDTAHHAQKVMAEGFPQRMGKHGRDAIDLMFDAKRYGQKNGVGFYRYELDKKGKPKKLADESTSDLLAQLDAAPSEFSDADIIARMMIPMILETVRCLEEGIVATPREADMALVYGIGFPPFRGGVFRYLQTMGLDKFVALAEQYEHLGPLYQLTDGLREMAASGKQYLQH